MFFSKFVSKIRRFLHYVYQYVPLPVSAKIRIKDWIYRHVVYIFRYSAHANATRNTINLLAASSSREHKLQKIVYVINYCDKATQHYRVFNYMKEFSKLGVSSRVIRESRVRIDDLLSADIVVFNRIAWNKRFEVIFEKLKYKKIPIVFDIDDLIFDPGRYRLLRGLTARPEHARSMVINGMHQWRRMLLECDFVTVSTFSLRREVEHLGKPAFVIPNSLGEDIQTLAESASIISKPDDNDYIKIAYLSGTKTHEEDFNVCKDAMIHILHDNEKAQLNIVGELEGISDFFQFGNQFKYHPLLPYKEMIRFLSTVDIAIAPLELNNAFTDAKSELKIFEPAIFSIPCVASPTSTFGAVINHRHNGMLAATNDDWYDALSELIQNREFRKTLGYEACKTIVPRFLAGTVACEALSVYQAALNNRIPKQISRQPKLEGKYSTKPAISVIAILYSKENEVRYFLESLRRQDINAPFEIILIDDLSPDQSVEVVEQYLYWKKFYSNDNINVRIIKNDKNLGNCISRNIGIKQAKADVIVIVDADCVFNPSFLSEHLIAHQTGDCDIAIGPRGIETNFKPPFSILGQLENNSDKARKESRFQDPINLDSFVNCVTRNISIKRSFATKLLFDEDFGYSVSSTSGFGWEDVEFGYRAYKKGGQIWYLPNTISVHVSHPSTIAEKTKPLRSLKNFRKLHEKHPDLYLESRQWTNKTFKAITDWAIKENNDLNDNEDYHFLINKLNSQKKIPTVSLPRKELRVLTHRWHCAHQYELYRLGHRFELVTGAGTKMCDNWSWNIRPMPDNANFISFESINIRDFDLLILHFDENILHPDRTCGKVPADWGSTFLSLLEFRKDLPTIAICHGTPQFRGQYDPSYSSSDLGIVDEVSKNEIVDLLKDVTVVCNSYQAAEAWKFHKSEVIWHGFSPHDFPSGLHDRQQILVMSERAMRNRPYYNGYFIYKEVQDQLQDIVEFTNLKVPEPSNLNRNSKEWAKAKFYNYVHELGQFAVYFNPTIRSPMPRIRGEAMMTGAITVSLKNHDVDKFINTGINGFYATETEELIEHLKFLVRYSSKRNKISEASRLTALDIFNQDRYLASWNNLIAKIMG